MPDIISHTQASMLAARAIQAQELSDDPPAEIVLPGAKVAVAHDRLLAHQQLGHDQDMIVAAANARWAETHAAQIAQHQEWTGRYNHALDRMREKQAQDAAAELKRRSEFEAWMRERGNA